jgi:uncharacterized cupin superfamily protein
MTQKEMISFSNSPKMQNRRRLADLPDRVVNGDPHHITDVHFESEDGSLISGSWTSTPGKWIAFSDRDEFCYIIYGNCRLVSDSGDVNSYKTGDAFLIPNGFSGYWEVIEETRKHFVIRQY